MTRIRLGNHWYLGFRLLKKLKRSLLPFSFRLWCARCIPLILAFTRNNFSIGVVALLGVIGSITAFSHLYQQIESRRLIEFEWLTLERHRALQRGVERGLEAVTTLHALFLTADEISVGDFHLFGDPVVARLPGIQSLAWVPRVGHRQRVAFEAMAGREAPNFEILESSLDKGKVRASERELYFPVLYESVAAGVDPNVGFDVGTLPEVREAMERAGESGHLALTGRLLLPGVEKPPRYGVLAVFPIEIARADRSTEVAGYAMGSFDIAKLAEAAMAVLEPRGVELLIQDESSPPEQRFLDVHSSRLHLGDPLREWGHPGDLQIKKEFPVADRIWSVTSAMVPEYRSGEAFAQGPWLVLVGGILLTAILSSYLYANRQSLLVRLRMETELREREEMFSQMTETVNEVFWAVPVDRSRFLYISYGFERIWRIPRQELYAHPELFFKGLHPEDRDGYEAAMRQLQKYPGPMEIDYRVVRRDGSLRWVHDSAFPVRDAYGWVYRIVGFAEDVTEKVLVEQALRESEQKLRALFNQSPDILMTVDAEGRILMLNRSLPGLSAERAAGQDSRRLFPPELWDWYRQALQGVLASGEIDHVQYSMADGSWWEARIVPILQQGQVTAVMVIASDITENRKLQTQAMHNARLATIGVLAAGVAHEINNPNNAILFSAGLLERAWREARPIFDEYAEEHGDFSLAGIPFSEAQETLPKLLAEIGANAKRISRIVENLKHLSKRDAGGLDERVDVAKALGAAAMILHAEIRKRTDHFVLRLNEDLPLIRGNAQQLEQVFINVLLNALESLPNRGCAVEARAQLAAEGDQVVVSIRDQGTGIAAEDLQRLKEPFFSTKTDSGGTGLGLSISNDIILRHRGRIEFSSLPREGTCVTIRLPVTD